MRFLPKYSSNTLFCFNAPVMLFTLTLEFIFAIYVIISSQLRSNSARIVTALLICLAIFQVAEYQVCTGSQSLFWMRLGYSSITLLPALGIHLITLVTKRNWSRNLGYILSLFFITVFLFSPESVHGAVCGGNYVLINTDGIVAKTYFPFYYYTSLTIALCEILSVTTGKISQEKEAKDSRSMLWWLLAGYASFIVPTAGIYLVSPAARYGMPSIMCGFAVMLAIILTLTVYPRCKKLGI